MSKGAYILIVEAVVALPRHVAGLGAQLALRTLRVVETSTTTTIAAKIASAATSKLSRRVGR